MALYRERSDLVAGRPWRCCGPYSIHLPSLNIRYCMPPPTHPHGQTYLHVLHFLSLFEENGMEVFCIFRGGLYDETVLCQTMVCTEHPLTPQVTVTHKLFISTPPPTTYFHLWAKLRKQMASIEAGISGVRSCAALAAKPASV